MGSMGLLQLKPDNARSTTFRTNPELEETGVVIAEQRTDFNPKIKCKESRYSPSLKDNRLPLGPKCETALPSLILKFGSESRAVLSNVLC